MGGLEAAVQLRETLGLVWELRKCSEITCCSVGTPKKTILRTKRALELVGSCLLLRTLRSRRHLRASQLCKSRR